IIYCSSGRTWLNFMEEGFLNSILPETVCFSLVRVKTISCLNSNSSAVIFFSLSFIRSRKSSRENPAAKRLAEKHTVKKTIAGIFFIRRPDVRRGVLMLYTPQFYQNI